MTIFQILKNDHRTVLKLFKQIEDLDQQRHPERVRLYRQVRQELLTHLDAEESELYPRLRNEDATREMTFEALEEHGLARHLIEEMDLVDPEDERWAAKIKVMREVVEHHIREEEQEIFPEMKSTFSTRELGELARLVEDYKNQAKPARRRTRAAA